MDSLATPATMRNDDSKAEGLNETDTSVFFGENNEFHKDQAEQEWRKRFSDIKQNPENVKQLMLWVQAIMMDLLLTDNADHWRIWDARWEKLSKLIKMMNFDFSASQRPNRRELAGTAQKERVRQSFINIPPTSSSLSISASETLPSVPCTPLSGQSYGGFPPSSSHNWDFTSSPIVPSVEQVPTPGEVS